MNYDKRLIIVLILTNTLKYNMYKSKFKTYIIIFKIDSLNEVAIR